MNVSVETNRGAWNSAIKQAAKHASKVTADTLLAESRDLTPKQEGALIAKGEVIETETGAAIEWNNAYAGYQWFGMRSDGTHVVKNYTTAGTGTMWAEKAAMQNADKLQKTAQNAFAEALK